MNVAGKSLGISIIALRWCINTVKTVGQGYRGIILLAHRTLLNLDGGGYRNISRGM